jgi:hypothetical protein
MAAKTFEQWWNENWEGLDGYDREGYAQAAWDAATELEEEKFNSALRQPTKQGSDPSEIKLNQCVNCDKWALGCTYVCGDSRCQGKG